MERERQAGDGGSQNPNKRVAHNCLAFYIHAATSRLRIVDINN